MGAPLPPSIARPWVEKLIFHVSTLGMASGGNNLRIFDLGLEEDFFSTSGMASGGNKSDNFRPWVSKSGNFQPGIEKVICLTLGMASGGKQSETLFDLGFEKSIFDLGRGLRRPKIY